MYQRLASVGTEQIVEASAQTASVFVGDKCQIRGHAIPFPLKLSTALRPSFFIRHSMAGYLCFGFTRRATSKLRKSCASSVRGKIARASSSRSVGADALPGA